MKKYFKKQDINYIIKILYKLYTIYNKNIKFKKLKLKLFDLYMV